MPASTPQRDEILQSNALLTLELNRARLEAAKVLLEIAVDQQHNNPKEARIAAQAVLRCAEPTLPFFPYSQPRPRMTKADYDDPLDDSPAKLDDKMFSLETRIARARHIREREFQAQSAAFQEWRHNCGSDTRPHRAAQAAAEFDAPTSSPTTHSPLPTAPPSTAHSPLPTAPPSRPLPNSSSPHPSPERANAP